MGSQKHETIAAYDASAVEYAAETAQLPDSILKEIERFFITELRGRIRGESDRLTPASNPGERVPSPSSA